jgi:uncharacterized repeat protein (TIGR01451 family)
MRLGIVLAATGATAAAFAVSAAQEGFYGRGTQPTGAHRTVQYLSRSGPTSHQTAPTRPVPVQGVRNYYDQLFAEPQPGDDPRASAHNSEHETADATLVHARFDRQRAAAPAGEIRQVSTHQAASPFSAPQTPPSPTSPAHQPQHDPFAAFERPAAAAPPAHAAEPESPFTIAPPVQPSLTTPHLPAAELAHTSPSNAPEEAAPSLERSQRTSPDASAMPRTPRASAATDSAHRLTQVHFNGPAAVEVRWERVSEITVGRECRCELVVKNSGAGAAGDLAVEAFFPPSVRLVAAEPKPTAVADHLTWTIPNLGPGAERRIAVTLVPNEPGDLQVSAFVRYTEAAATTLAVREPLLEVALSGPEQVALGETVAQSITVSNPGTGTAQDVRVEITLPPGLEHARGSTLSMPVGSLAAGQSQVIRLALFATQGGPQTIHIRATASETLRHEATANVLVAAPSLKVVAEGPSLRYVGRDAVYRIRVINDGASPANNVRVAHVVPKGFRFVRADQGGRYEAGPGQIIWYVGRVDAGQTVELAAELSATGLGSHQHVVTVSGEGGAKAETVLRTAVDGTASLVVEVLDLDDPVEVGTETAYEIRVRNEGTKVATHVEIACQVPSGVAVLSARGPTAHQAQGNLLTFSPIGELEPGKTALYRVVVRGTMAGKHRFRVRLTSDSIDEPLIHEELTHYYAD